MRRTKMGILAAVVVITLAVPRPATAFIKGFDSIIWVITFVETTLLVGGLTTAIANGVYAGRGQRAPVGWIATGYTFGVLNMAWGGIMLGYARSPGPIAVMSVHVGLGALGIGMSAWSQTRKPKESVVTSGLSIGPIRFADRSGHPAFGLALRYVH
ncbi:MAG: hypothetical protein KC609_11980 [Myxococcales bacterium]|nr:hypothetical protein [Myxococcales bacterium]